MLKKIVLVAVLVLVALAVFISTRPAQFRVTRSTTIAAPARAVYSQVADFRRWDSWSPWAHLDPEMKTTHAGDAAAVGSSYAWKGNDKVGEGSMTITEARPGQKLEIRLVFLRPFPQTNTTTFTFAPAGSGTKVDWSMEGRNNFMGKAFGIVMDFDKMIGRDFDAGLAKLKSVSEAEAGKAAAR